MTIPKKPAMRWRKQPDEIGLSKVGQAPRGAELRRGEEVLVTVTALGGGALTGPLRGWYWYGLGKNTSQSPKPTLSEAKAEAGAHAREHLKPTS